MDKITNLLIRAYRTGDYELLSQFPMQEKYEAFQKMRGTVKRKTRRIRHGAA
jgi:hypothetical protein